jgi:hypothetical protein
MSDKELNNAAAKQQRLVVKNKKYKKSDIVAIVICLLAALLIWVHATNIEKAEAQLRDEHLSDLVDAAAGEAK